MDKLISEIIELPSQVRRGDFVLNLSKGVTEPEKTLDQYVVTPQLAGCFDDALGFIKGSVEARNSKACYLHGSFGSGKSHFMAVLHLFLQHNPAVRGIAELAPVVAKHEWVEDKKFLLVPYHMIGARSTESAILGGYVDHVMEKHPDAPLPGVYLADEIFDNAAELRRDLGDEKFFGKLNRGQSGGDADGWGTLATGWDGARFDAALKAAPGSEERTRLVGDLVQHVLTAFRGIADGKDEAYVDLDSGLSVISSHAKDLGYDGLILFLDELILWLATHSADLNFVQTEGNKLAKLVESRKADRPVPVISFVARQRDLRELIGENVSGADQLNFSDVLSHWEGRFHTITLEDRNLPVIAQRRVLRPKSEAARAELEDAFEKTAQVRQEILQVLLTREADRAMFKQVYPFSPALIQALVAVSSALQRERTALKLMLQMLVNRRDTLRLGDVIPLGDLWDVVAHGDEAFSDVMRVAFENAKKLYQQKLRPMLEQQHVVDLEVDKERARKDPEIAERIKQFENDDRLIKSLLLCALVDGVETLRNMTCMRLAALNHGSIKSRIPGREHQMVAQKLRTWAGTVGEIRVGSEPTDPTVSIQLAGVDTEGIIEAARSFDNAGNRQRKIRQMVFQSMGIEEQDGAFTSHPFLWRGSRRYCDVRFSNVRTLPDQSLRSGEDWLVIIDFPFDDEGHSPIEDLDHLNEFRERNQQSRTLVWLPAFFSARTQTELGRLVIIDQLLKGTNLEQYGKHLSAQDRETAKLLLQNQQSALFNRLQQIMEAAYAIRGEPTPGTLDAGHDMSEQHFQSLYPSLRLQLPVGATLGEALQHLLDQALSHQFPKHPEFGQEVKAGKDLRQVLEVCRGAARTPDGRVLVDDKPVRNKVRNICDPLGLGKMAETHFVLDPFWKNHFNRCHAQSHQPHPTAGDLRKYMNQPEERGLPREIQDLLILVYADQTNRSFFRYGGSFEPDLGNVPDELDLLEQALPDSRDWETAAGRVAELFGHTIPKQLNARTLSMLVAKVSEDVAAFKADCDALPGRLQVVLKGVGASDSEISGSARIKTSLAARDLLVACDGKEGPELVDALVHSRMETSATAMGRSIKSAQAVLNALRSTKWELFAGVGQLADARKTDAELLMAEVRGDLMLDEQALAGGLAQKLAAAETRAIKLLAPPVQAQAVGAGAGAPDPPPPPAKKAGWRVVQSKEESVESEAGVSDLAKRLAELLRARSDRRLTLRWTLEEGPE